MRSCTGSSTGSTPEDIAAITAQAYAEMLETGYTRVGEFHYLHNDPGRRAAMPTPPRLPARSLPLRRSTGIGLAIAARLLCP